jgi:hypothetical protein
MGEEYILVIQDMTTRWVELAPMKNTDTASILDKFMVSWVCRYGPPQRLLTDRASTFVGTMSQEYCRFFGIEKIHTTAYRPQGNGMNERMHQELTKYFSMYLDGQSKAKWRWLLHDAAWAYNTAYHTALGTSPYEVLFGVPPPFGPLGIPQLTEEIDDFPKFFGLRRKQLLERRKLTQQSIATAQEKMVQYQNRHTHAIRFKIGDYVLYQNHNKKTKWDPKFLGPWKITDIISPVVYELDLDGYRFTAHATYLKPYKGHPHALDTPAPADNRLEIEIALDTTDPTTSTPRGHNAPTPGRHTTPTSTDMDTSCGNKLPRSSRWRQRAQKIFRFRSDDTEARARLQPQAESDTRTMPVHLD